MKKILALVLAVAMLSTVAFAGTFAWNGHANPGDTLKLGASAFAGTTAAAGSDPLANGMDNYDFTSDNFAVTAKWKKGADLVESVKFDDVKVKITLKDSTSLTVDTNKAPNVVLDKITVKAKKSIKKWDAATNKEVFVMRSGNTYEYKNADATKQLWVGYDVTSGAADVEVDDVTTLVAGDFTKVVKNKTAGRDVNVQWNTALYSADQFSLEGKVYVGDKIFFDFDKEYSDAAKDLAKKNEDATIDYTKITLDGLSASHKIVLSAEKDAKVYKLVDGKLAPSGLTWNEDEYGFVGKIRSTTEYVVSDIELKGVTTGGSETSNPDTGANDVVGIAAALAVVSLVAAGAVSLKK